MKKIKQHRTILGDLVDPMSSECLEDLNVRIEDATFNRDCCPHGSANRTHYNGLLNMLRKHRKKINKHLAFEELNNTDLDEDGATSYVSTGTGQGDAFASKSSSKSSDAGDSFLRSSTASAASAQSKILESNLKDLWLRIIE